MVIGTSISLWRYLAQSQVDSQTHAERRFLNLSPDAGKHGPDRHGFYLHVLMSNSWL